MLPEREGQLTTRRCAQYGTVLVECLATAGSELVRFRPVPQQKERGDAMDNLTKDCLEAQRLGYGVHYGWYKADHPHTADHFCGPAPLADGAKIRTCVECGFEFRPYHKNDKYCCEACRNKASQRRHRERLQPGKDGVPVRKCVVCGKAFGVGKISQETCSRSCGQRYRSQRKKTADRRVCDNAHERG